MTKVEMVKVVEEINELVSFAEEIKKEIESKQDLLKNQMSNEGVDVLDLDSYYVRWSSVISNRLDTTKMKKELPSVYNSYLKAVESKRFQISVA